MSRYKDDPNFRARTLAQMRKTAKELGDKYIIKVLRGQGKEPTPEAIMPKRAAILASRARRKTHDSARKTGPLKNTHYGQVYRAELTRGYLAGRIGKKSALCTDEEIETQRAKIQNFAQRKADLNQLRAAGHTFRGAYLALRTATLPDSHVAMALAKPTAQCTPEELAAKRQSILQHRQIKALPLVERKERTRQKTVKNTKGQRSRVTPSYVASLFGTPVAAIPPALVDLKRVHLKIIRKLKDINEARK